MQDVPSFLQEVTTVRGQLLYGTAALRARAGVPEDTDPHDEVTVAQLERLVTLDDMRQRKRAGGSNGSAHKAGIAEQHQGDGNTRCALGATRCWRRRCWAASICLRRALPGSEQSSAMRLVGK